MTKKNNKPLQGVTHEGKQVYEIRGPFNKRILYIKEGTQKKIIKEFTKKNRSTTGDYL